MAKTIKKSNTKKAIVLKKNEVGPFYHYKMNKQSAYAATHDLDGRLLKDVKGRENEYLIDYVNDQFGLMGTCVAVAVG